MPALPSPVTPQERFNARKALPCPETFVAFDLLRSVPLPFTPQERFNARKALPCREMVQDEVEAALAREIGHLNTVTSQLVNKLNAVDKAIAALDLTALSIEDNLRDK